MVRGTVDHGWRWRSCLECRWGVGVSETDCCGLRSSPEWVCRLGVVRGNVEERVRPQTHESCTSTPSFCQSRLADARQPNRQPINPQRNSVMTNSTQITASVAPGTVKPFVLTGPNGSDSPFSIAKGFVFVITDISMQRLSVVGTSSLFNFALQQTLRSGTVNRWAFVGKVTENVERTFNDGIVFSTVPSLEKGSQSADVVVVRAWGHFVAQY